MAPPIGELLYVGHSTKEKLEERFFRTIGDVAKADPTLLQAMLGKWGPELHAVANGWDNQPVVPIEEADEVQSVSNGMTTPRDLTDDRDIKQVITALAESVGRRLREQRLCGRTVELHLRDNRLVTHTYRTTLDHYIQTTSDVTREAYALFRDVYHWSRPLRSVTVCVSSLEAEDTPFQLDMTDRTEQDKHRRLDCTVDSLRERFGSTCICRAISMEDPNLTAFDPKSKDNEG